MAPLRFTVSVEPNHPTVVCVQGEAVIFPSLRCLRHWKYEAPPPTRLPCKTSGHSNPATT